MRVRIYRITEKPLEVIKLWFETQMGFRPTDREAIAFSVHTLYQVKRDEIELESMKVVPGRDYRYTAVSPETIKIARTCVENFPIHFHDAHVFVNVMIQLRAMSLPKPKEAKLLQIKSPPNKGGYIPRLMTIVKKRAS